MKLLTGAAILAANDLPHEDVEVPEWGGTVRVRAMSAGAAEAFYRQLDKNPQASARAGWIALCAVDADGKPLFSQADIPRLDDKSNQAVQRVWDVVARLNGLGGGGDDLEKNSEPSPGGDSPSG